MRYLLTSAIAILILWGCAANPRSGSTESTNSSLPGWWIDRSVSDDYYFGYGMAKKQNPSLGLKTATMRGRDDIAAQISVKVENLMKDFMQESGVGENAQSLEFTSSVSKQVISKTLEGCEPDKQEDSKDGTWFVRVRYSKNDVRRAINESAKREEALFNEFKATQGFEELEKAVQGMN